MTCRYFLPGLILALLMQPVTGQAGDGTSLAAASSAKESGARHPVLLGVDVAGSYHQTVARVSYWKHEPFFRAMSDLGVQFVNVHLFPIVVPGQDSSQRMRESIEAIDRGLRDHGLRYTLDLESPNFRKSGRSRQGLTSLHSQGGCTFGNSVWTG